MTYLADNSLGSPPLPFTSNIFLENKALKRKVCESSRNRGHFQELSSPKAPTSLLWAAPSGQLVTGSSSPCAREPWAFCFGWVLQWAVSWPGCLSLASHQWLWKPWLWHVLHELTLKSVFWEKNGSTNPETQREALWRATYNHEEKKFKYLRQDPKSSRQQASKSPLCQARANRTSRQNALQVHIWSGHRNQTPWKEYRPKWFFGLTQFNLTEMGV